MYKVLLMMLIITTSVMSQTVKVPPYVRTERAIWDYMTPDGTTKVPLAYSDTAGVWAPTYTIVSRPFEFSGLAASAQFYLYGVTPDVKVIVQTCCGNTPDDTLFVNNNWILFTGAGPDSSVGMDVETSIIKLGHTSPVIIPWSGKYFRFKVIAGATQTGTTRFKCDVIRR
jgi:hypothetical protein